MFRRISTDSTLIWISIMARIRDTRPTSSVRGGNSRKRWVRRSRAPSAVGARKARERPQAIRLPKPATAHPGITRTGHSSPGNRDAIRLPDTETGEDHLKRCYTSVLCQRFPGGSTAEQSAVNRWVVGSNPTRGASSRSDGSAKAGPFFIAGDAPSGCGKPDVRARQSPSHRQYRAVHDGILAIASHLEIRPELHHGPS